MEKVLLAPEAGAGLTGCLVGTQGEEILAELMKVPSRGITLRVAVNPPSSRMSSTDLQNLEERGESGQASRHPPNPQCRQGLGPKDGEGWRRNNRGPSDHARMDGAEIKKKGK